MADNPTRIVLRDMGVVLPAEPMDLSSALAAAGVRKGYVIVMTGRAGSTWLATALRQIAGAGYPREYLTDDSIASHGRSQPGQSMADLLTDLATRHADDGTFGFKIDPMRLAWLETVMATVPTMGGPAGVWIDMRRRDIVKQAFSFARAKRTGQWHIFADRPAARAGHVAVTDEEVWAEVAHILRNEAWIDAYYARHDLRPLRILYEDLHESRLHVLCRVLHAIDPHRAWESVQGIADGTVKLAGAAEAADELDFVMRHVARVSRLMEGRATPGPAVMPAAG